MNKPLNVPRRPVLLVIMDGIGVNPCKLDNAVAMASTPNLDAIYAHHPTCLIEASGRAVGLPDGQMGNSEVGHLTIGAGSVLKQDLVKISDAIADRSFATNDVLVEAIGSAKAAGQPMHLVGLVSDGGVHSHIEHLIALIELCASHGVTPVLHMITDGRDTAPSCALSFWERVKPVLASANGSVATVAGRYYALDRDKRWERVEKAWRAMMLAEGNDAATVEDAITMAADADETDEFITPTVIRGYQPVEKEAHMIFFNFRNDRPRELSEALAFAQFNGFERGDYTPAILTTFTSYESSYPFKFAFTKDVADVTLGDCVAAAGIAQMRIAETEKYPHVTFFMNGGRDEPLAKEAREMLNSPKVATYDLQPEMSAAGITDAVEAAIASNEYGLIVVNYANGDMVGHAGVPEATIKAVEVVDDMVGRIWQKAREAGFSILLTADHGNADMMVDPVTRERHTQHTTFPVACCIHDPDVSELGCGHALTGLAPTTLALMGLAQPAGMTSGVIFLGTL